MPAAAATAWCLVLTTRQEYHSTSASVSWLQHLKLQLQIGKGKGFKKVGISSLGEFPNIVKIDVININLANSCPVPGCSSGSNVRGNVSPGPGSRKSPPGRCSGSLANNDFHAKYRGIKYVSVLGSGSSTT